MTEANETRGEISLELGGTEYTMRPTYEAVSYTHLTLPTICSV